jgi:hypothetical protein
MSWKNRSTRRGQIEAVIEPIISGGATQDSIDTVVSILMSFIPAETLPPPTQSVAALKSAIRNELRDGYCFNRMNEAKRALRNIQNIITCTSWSTP